MRQNVDYPEIALIESSPPLPLVGKLQTEKFDWALSHPAAGWMFAKRHHGGLSVAASMVGIAFRRPRKRWRSGNLPETSALCLALEKQAVLAHRPGKVWPGKTLVLIDGRRFFVAEGGKLGVICREVESLIPLRRKKRREFQ